VSSDHLNISTVLTIRQWHGVSGNLESDRCCH
jgi:hypothetical protein